MICAICADEVDAAVRRPLGRNDAMVNVCIACDTEPPREVNSDRQWEPSGGLLGPDESTAGARRAMGNAEYERVARMEDELSRKPAPGANASDADWIAYQHENTRRFRSRAAKRRSHKSSRQKKMY